MTTEETEKKKKRTPLDYRVFEVQTEEGEDGKDRLVLVEADTPKASKPGSQALLRALRQAIQDGDDSYNGRTLVVAGLSDMITIKVESKRVVSFD